MLIKQLIFFCQLSVLTRVSVGHIAAMMIFSLWLQKWEKGLCGTQDSVFPDLQYHGSLIITIRVLLFTDNLVILILGSVFQNTGEFYVIEVAFFVNWCLSVHLIHLLVCKAVSHCG